MIKISYFKRFKMEVELADAPPPPPLPPGYFWAPWDDTLLEAHAGTKFQCFQDEIDAAVFPSLSTREGCRALMTEIRKKSGFLPLATWLIGCPDGFCATVQGVSERPGLGAIQNLGVTPAHRGRGLGSTLLLKALEGFALSGMGRAFLEVTAQNDAAVRLYRRAGFRSKKTVYKAVEATAGVI